MRPKTVVIDFNDPLAGKTLHFEVTVREVRAATPEELEHGPALLLTQVQARVKQAFGREPSMLELFEHPSIESLAAFLVPSVPAPEPSRASALPSSE